MPAKLADEPAAPVCTAGSCGASPPGGAPPPGTQPAELAAGETTPAAAKEPLAAATPAASSPAAAAPPTPVQLASTGATASPEASVSHNKPQQQLSGGSSPVPQTPPPATKGAAVDAGMPLQAVSSAAKAAVTAAPGGAAAPGRAAAPGGATAPAPEEDLASEAATPQQQPPSPALSDASTVSITRRPTARSVFSGMQSPEVAPGIQNVATPAAAGDSPAAASAADVNAAASPMAAEAEAAAAAAAATAAEPAAAMPPADAVAATPADTMPAAGPAHGSRSAPRTVVGAMLDRAWSAAGRWSMPRASIAPSSSASTGAGTAALSPQPALEPQADFPASQAEAELTAADQPQLPPPSSERWQMDNGEPPGSPIAASPAPASSPPVSPEVFSTPAAELPASPGAFSDDDEVSPLPFGLNLSPAERSRGGGDGLADQSPSLAARSAGGGASGGWASGGGGAEGGMLRISPLPESRAAATQWERTPELIAAAAVATPQTAEIATPSTVGGATPYTPGAAGSGGFAAASTAIAMQAVLACSPICSSPDSPKVQQVCKCTYFTY